MILDNTYTRCKTNSSMSDVRRRVDKIVKSASDKRLYRGLELHNGMKVLLISDGTTDKSAASLEVNIGHLNDPEGLPGLAHFCEHMLFLGTEKYPSENEYSRFLSEHGGSSNAGTGSDYTDYYFDVAPEHLSGALDRFGQFFLSPLFTESATDREVKAVNSEHLENVQNDSRRLNRLQKSLAKKLHAYQKFGTGNIQTLDIIPKEKGINVRAELLKFHETWYSSNIMSLAILGKESLNELETMVLDIFAGVKNKNIKTPTWPEHPYGPEQLKIKEYVVPIKDVRWLKISFPIPDLVQYYKSAPGDYLSHLIGHEGHGSLLSPLQARNWCNGLWSWCLTTVRGFGFFIVWVDITEEGIDHIDDIVKLFFQYVNMLKNEQPQKWVHEECRDMKNIKFRFKDKKLPMEYTSGIVHNLREFPLEEVLCCHSLITEWRPDLINKVLDYLNPDNVRIVVVSQKYADVATETEPWYGTKYMLESIPENTINQWKESDYCDDLKLPVKNEFIPTDFSLLPRKEPTDSTVVSSHPSIIQDTPLCRVWFKQDDEFLLPKANLFFKFVSPLACLDPMNSNMTYMFVRLVRDSLIKYVYPAELAGMGWNLYDIKYGIVLKIGGYNNKQHLLLDMILEKLINFKVEPKRFDVLKECFIRSLKNFEMDQPCERAGDYLPILLAEQEWTDDELLAAAEQLTHENVEEFVPQFVSKMRIECLIHGNVDKEKAIQLVNLVEKRLHEFVILRPLLPRQLLRNREIQLGDRSNFVFKIFGSVHRNSCMKVYYQCNLQSTQNNMILELLVQIINEPCFDILRTKEQLGYIVSCKVRRANGVQGLLITVQSERHPSYVDKRVEAFLANMVNHIHDLSTEEFEQHKEALASLRLEKPKKLSELSSHFWSEIISQQYNFGRDIVEVEHLRTLEKQDVLDFANNLININAPHRHKLAVHVISTVEGGAGTETPHLPATIVENTIDGFLQLPSEYEEPVVIENITTFKSSQGMFPLVQPYIYLETQPKL